MSSELSLRNVRILVVDDSDINRDLTRCILESEGARVGVAINGLDAVDALRVQRNWFDVVLMDLQMPVLDGHAAARRIRAELGMTHLPILALTADARSSERALAVESGMDDVIVKPFGARALLSAILRHVKPEMRERGTSPVVPSSEPSANPPNAWPEIAGIDSENAQTRLGCDAALFRTLIERLLIEYADLSVRPDADDAEYLGRHAGRMHRLRGAAGLLGAMAIHDLAGDAESACADGDGARARLLTTEIAGLLEKMREGIRHGGRFLAATADT